MATGAGNLPNPSMSFSPFAILTAEEQNQIVANIESLASGTGFGDGALLSALPAPYIGFIPAATFGSTGNKSITGLGFKPRLVQFTPLQTPAITQNYAVGAMTPNAQYVNGISYAGGTGYRRSTKTAAVGFMGAANFDLLASYVSMDSDGFTINVTVPNSAFEVAFTAYP